MAVEFAGDGEGGRDDWLVNAQPGAESLGEGGFAGAQWPRQEDDLSPVHVVGEMGAQCAHVGGGCSGDGGVHAVSLCDAFAADEFDDVFECVDGVRTVGFALFVRPCELAEALRHARGCPSGQLFDALRSIHGAMFDSACVMVPARTAEALAMERSFIASAPMSAMGSVPWLMAERIMMTAWAPWPASAWSAMANPVT